MQGMSRYGSYTAEIEAVIERVRNLTPAELKTVEDNWIHTWTPEARPIRERAEQRALNAIKGGVGFAQWWTALETLRAAYKESVAKGFSYPAWDAALDVCYAYFASEHISTRTFNILSRPWKSIMDGER